MAKSQGRGNAEWVNGLVLLVATLCCLLGAADAVQHQVGGTAGWTLPSIGNVNYTLWESNQTFRVGDTLYFNYSKAYHNVLEVTEANYQSCNVSSPIQVWDDGATVVKLNATGSFYFICGFTGHCGLGQKVSVKVLAATGSAPSPSPLSPASSSPTATPPTSPAPSSSPSSSSSSSSSGSTPGPSPSPSSTPPSRKPAFAFFTIMAIAFSVSFISITAG